MPEGRKLNTRRGEDILAYIGVPEEVLNWTQKAVLVLSPKSIPKLHLRMVIVEGDKPRRPFETEVKTYRLVPVEPEGE